MQMSKVLWKSGLVIKLFVIITCENQMRIEHSCNLDQRTTVERTIIHMPQFYLLSVKILKLPAKIQVLYP